MENLQFCTGVPENGVYNIPPNGYFNGEHDHNPMAFTGILFSDKPR
jgi:hypothetical protein